MCACVCVCVLCNNTERLIASYSHEKRQRRYIIFKRLERRYLSPSAGEYVSREIFSNLCRKNYSPRYYIIHHIVYWFRIIVTVFIFIQSSQSFSAPRMTNYLYPVKSDDARRCEHCAEKRNVSSAGQYQKTTRFEFNRILYRSINTRFYFFFYTVLSVSSTNALMYALLKTDPVAIRIKRKLFS